MPDRTWTFPKESTARLIERIEEYGGAGEAQLEVIMHGTSCTVNVVGAHDDPINESEVHPPP